MSVSHQRPFLDVLHELRRGRFAAEATERLHELIASVKDAGKSGTLTIKLTITPDSVADYETPRIQLADSITLAKPRPSVRPSTFFIDDEGNAVRNDPNQEAFQGLRPVERTADDTTSTSTRKAL